MGFEIVIAIFSAIVGFFGLIKGINTRLPCKNKMTIRLELEDGRRFGFDTTNIKNEDVEKLLLWLTETTNAERSNASKESGSVALDVLLLVIPGLIALLLVGVFVYLLVANQSNPDYTAPKELSVAMTTIIGYYFGIGASTAINKGKTLTPDEIRALLQGSLSVRSGHGTYEMSLTRHAPEEE
jgi:hypothetical protein